MSNDHRRLARVFRSALGVLAEPPPQAPSWAEITDRVEHPDTRPASSRSGGRRRLVMAIAAAIAVAAAGAVFPIMGLLDDGAETPVAVPPPTTVEPTTSAVTPSTTVPVTSPIVVPPPPIQAVLAINVVHRLGPASIEMLSGTVQETGVVGAHVVMSLGPDGFPVLAYADWSNRSIWVARCSDATCSAVAQTEEVASFDRLAGLALGLTGGGDPVVAFTEHPPRDAPEGDDDVLPPATLSLVAVDGTTTRIAEAVHLEIEAIHVGGDGAPVIVFSNFIPDGGPELTVLACEDLRCASQTETGLQSGLTGDLLTVAFDPLGRPTWVDLDEDRLVLKRCADSLCLTEVAMLPLAGPAPSWDGGTALAFLPNGAPFVAYQAESGDGIPYSGDEVLAPITIVVCEDPQCDSSSVESLDGGAGGFDLSWSAIQAGVGPDGTPLIAWNSDHQLWLADCLDQTCSEATVTGTPARVADRSFSVTAGEAGYPLVAHFTGTDVAVLACVDAACTAPEPPSIDTVSLAGASWETKILVTGTGDWLPRLWLDPDGRLVAAAESEHGIDLAICRDADCSAVDSVSMRGDQDLYYTTVVIPLDGRPVAITGFAATVARCTDPECTTLESLVIEESDNWIGGDITVGRDDLPILVYPDVAERAAPVKVAACLDPACTETAITTLDSTYGAWSRPRIVTGSNGLPVIAYPAWDQLRIAVCGDPACTEATIVTLDTSGSGDDGPIDLIIDRAGNPVVTFNDGASRIKIAICGDPACTDFTVTTLASPFEGFVAGVGISSEGYPMVAYTADDDAYLAACETPDCDRYRTVRLDGISRLDVLPSDHPEYGAPVFRFITTPDGRPMIIQLVDVVVDPDTGDAVGDLVAVRCTDTACLVAVNSM